MERIYVIGIGWREDDLTLGAVKQLRAGHKVVLRTGRCECAEWLSKEGISFESLDELYEQCYDFDELIEQSVSAILSMAENEPITYCVNDLSDKTCSGLCQQAGSLIDLIPGVSEGTSLMPFAGEDVRIVSAADADLFEADAHLSTLIRELDNPMLASDIKLKLTERYPDELTIYICDAHGRIRTIQLCELDWQDDYDHRMCALIPAVRDLNRLERYDVRHLEEVMRRLRDFDGDPWDREQTHQSLRPHLIEEAYEVADAIDREDMDDLYDELGDVLLMVIFHSDIAKQYGEFELSDVTTAICKKMIRRHPNVFADAQIRNMNEAFELWDEIKKQERAQKSTSETMKSVAGSLPGLMRAANVTKRSGQPASAYQALENAWTEWKASSSPDALGELLLELADTANRAGINAELALNKAIDRFIRKFEETEANQ